VQRLTDKLRRLHPDHLRIARAGLWLLAFTLAAKLAGAAKEIVVAWRFGRGPEVDAYNLALTLATWLPASVVTVMAVVLVPAIVRLGSDPAEARGRFLRELNGVALLGGTVLSAATWLCAPLLVRGFTGGLPAETAALATGMVRAFSLLPLLTVVSGMQAARLQALQDHRYALAEGLPSLAIVVLLLAWLTADTGPLVAGTLLGFVWQAWWLHRHATRAAGPAGLSLSLSSRPLRGLWRGALVMGAGQLAISLIVPLDQWFAAGLGTGAIATLGYANRVIALVMTLGGVVVSRATLPVFSAAVAGGEGARVRRHALRWGGLMFLVGVAAAAAMWALATPIVGLLFERGAFSRQDTQAVAEALRWGIWQVPPFLASLVFYSEVAARRRYGVIAAFAAANLACKAAGNLFFGPILGLNGILLATVVMFTLSMLLFLLAVRREVVHVACRP
jgi:peptidoglycan biosynthesis protein MviN/MurJ (putative lipid II flippase)